jgi:hypothetical protein
MHCVATLREAFPTAKAEVGYVNSVRNTPLVEATTLSSESKGNANISLTVKFMRLRHKYINFPSSILPTEFRLNAVCFFYR